MTREGLEVAYWITSSLILIVSIVAMYRGPIKAVKIGRKLDDESYKKENKTELFLTLFAYRGSPIHIQFVNSLNEIDVVFQDDKEVLDSWHKYYEALHQPGSINQEEIWKLHRADLLSKMAVSLGYNSLKQTDIMKHYYPEGYQHQKNDQWEFRYYQKEYFKSGAEMHQLFIDTHPANQNSEDEQS